MPDLTNKLSIFCRLQISRTMPRLSFRGRRELSMGLQLQQKDQNYISQCCQARNQGGGGVINITLRCPH